MLIIPIAHSKSVKEFPWVTITLIVVCIAVWFWTLSVHNRVQQRIEAAAQLLQSALQAAPEDTCTNEEQVWVAMVMDQWALPTCDLSGERTPDPLVEGALAELNDTIQQFPWIRLGYRPKFRTIETMFTSMFMHGGWLHLIGNMLFLWLAGTVLEDVWGRGKFFGLYLITGCAAVIGQHMLTPDSAVPLVGASGAISGLLGAILPSARNLEIRIFYFLWIFTFRFYTGTIMVHAWFAIPLWFAVQVFSLFFGTADGVSYMAHVSGFVAGLAAAWGANRLGWIDFPPPPPGTQPLFERTKPNAKLPTFKRHHAD